MSLRSRMISGGMLVGASQTLIMALSFGRNVIIGRMVSIPDMGIAATIALALQIIESASEMNVNQLIIQSKDGDDPRLQANAHTFMVLRGLITAVILVLSGGPLARLFGVPDAAWAFRMMALAPLIRGFVHQDLWRYHRAMNFGPLVRVELFSQTIALLAAWPLARWLGDYSVMLWVILIQVVIVAVCSHLAHERPYRLGLNRDYVLNILRFGWPLLFNGILILFLNYGDRFVIAAYPAYSMTDVGLYMVATSVALMPTMLVCKLAAQIVLPALARSQDDRERFTVQLQSIARIIGLTAILQTTLLIIAGPSLVVLFFGEKYLPVAAFFGWIAASSGVRILRLTPTLGALALGDSKNTLIANIARCSGFVVALVAASLGAGLEWFAIAAFFGELVSLTVSMTSLAYRKSIYDPTTIVATVLLVVAIAISMGIFEFVRGPDVAWMVPPLVASIAGAATIAIAASVFDPDRKEYHRIREKFVPFVSRFRV